jgi:hypothetical protein
LADLACNPCDDEPENKNYEGQEAAKPKGILAPFRPSVKEVEEHNLTHLPYRSWCIFCVKEKSKDDPHRRRLKDEESQQIPVASIDYMYKESWESRLKRKEKERTKASQSQEEEEEESKGMPILVFKDSSTKLTQARVVRKKGRDKYAIERLQKDVANLGYKKLILKSNNEAPRVALKQAVKRERDEDIILEESCEYDSMGNG